MRMRLLVGGLGVGLLIAATGCSDEDDKNDGKRGRGAGGSDSGGTAGDAGSGGVGAAGNGGIGASSGAGGSAGNPGGSGGTDSGGTSSGGNAGTSSGGTGAVAASGGVAGSAGSAGSGGGCPSGFGDCDSNPTDCETDLNLVTSCGSCTNSCNGANGSVACQTGTCVITSCDANFGDCDGDPSNGCEVDLSLNDSHCGACDRDCAAAGTTCVTGNVCGAVTLHSGLPIGTDNSNAYTWADNDDAVFAVGYYNYTVRRMPLDGSAASAVWSASSVAAGRGSLLANATDVIWVQRGTPSTVLKKPHTALPTDLPSIVFTPQYQPYHLRVKGNAYYWFSGDYQSGDPYGYIYTRSVNAPSNDPGTLIMSVNQGNHGTVRDFAVSDDALYWYTPVVTPGEIRTTPLSGGTPTTVPTGIIASGYGNDRVKLRTIGTDLLYNRVEGTSFANGIYRWTPGDTTPGTQLVSKDNVIDFIVDSSFIYYVALNTAGVFKVPLAGGAGVQIASIYGNRILHQDSDSLYIANAGSGSTTIYRVLK
ncbi:MAG: hypothetical protein AB7K71_15290 [Polyangiaceae bacterium]